MDRPPGNDCIISYARPICKVLLRVLIDRPRLVEKSFFAEYQADFRERRSTVKHIYRNEHLFENTIMYDVSIWQSQEQTILVVVSTNIHGLVLTNFD